MKKWITKAEITKILNTYSVKNGEFISVDKTENFYKSQVVHGYIISIAEEKISGEKTGRILVSHTRANGKRTYQDAWERDENGDLQFCFRNLWNQPFSDAECIRDLEEQIQQLKEAGRKLQEQLDNQKQITSEKTNTESQKLNTETKHNARGAGRKRLGESPKTIEKLNQVKELLDKGFEEQEIMEKLGISRATFYRYKKNLKN